MRFQVPDVDLLVKRILNQQSHDLAKLSGEVLTSFANPLGDSPAAKDRTWAAQTEHVELTQGAYTAAAQSVATLLQSIEEYLQGILALLSSDQMLALPTMNCVRAIHDAALRVCSLVDPQISSQERLARSAADFLAGIQGGIPVLLTLKDALGDSTGDLQRVRTSREGAIALFRSIGLTVKVNDSTGQVQNVRCEDKISNVDLKTTDLSLKYTPDIDFSWKMNSGATHSCRWLSNGLDGPWPVLLTSMIFPLLDISDALTTNLLGYVGLPTGAIHKDTHMRRCFLMGRIGVSQPYSDHVEYLRRGARV
ncbi:hypothetical protein [Arthrobacter sp. H35-D1]|uniref:hypothetical protein n=1 Tax=Arthrobacter sp. H35-D1 TaxID=3046202 RepID=UPI0024BA2604|nr:hypothetical protein [Arthrobacter sp. H35-D1]MDJ0314037.1 hypothetical protein [Arthrobacter sp. H35-D1]